MEHQKRASNDRRQVLDPMAGGFLRGPERRSEEVCPNCEAIAADILDFNDKCAAEEYTDTGIVWELLAVWYEKLTGRPLPAGDREKGAE